MTPLTDLERVAIEKFLEGAEVETGAAILRRQLDQVEVTGREFTGVGFYTSLAVPSTADRYRQGRGGS